LNRYVFSPDWPTVSRNPADMLAYASAPVIGLDTEFDSNETPTILGVSDGISAVCDTWENARPYLIELLRRNPNVRIVGHAIISSDLFVMEKAGIVLPLTSIDDTMLRWWLSNAHLCKASGKSSLEEDEGERRGRGFMNLGSMCSVTTSLSFWKQCRGETCDDNVPCPKHNIFSYCGMDALGAAQAHTEVSRLCRFRNVEKLYPMHRELAFQLAEMSRHGVTVDVPYLTQMRTEFEQDKRLLEKQCNTLGFNPDSPKQVKEFFAQQKIILSDAQEETIRNAVEEYPENDDLGLLLDYKELGNGPDRWFKERYRDEKGWWKGFLTPEGKVHCRIGFFTSSGRLNAVDPNLQNTPRRRLDRTWCDCSHEVSHHQDRRGRCSECECVQFKGQSVGKKVRRAIIAPEGHYLLKADYQNGENRVYLHLAGYRDIPPGLDFHTWMADNIGLDPNEEFSVKMGGRREAAKSTTHGCLTGDHEVLTRQGWIPIADAKDKEIAQWSTDGIVSFVMPTKFHQYSYSGEMLEISGRGLKTHVTKDHLFPAYSLGHWRDKQYQNYYKVPFEEIKTSYRIPVCGQLHFEEAESLSDLEIRQGVAIQADASRVCQRAEFHLVRERKKKRIEELFGVEGRPCGCHPTGKRYKVTVNSRIIGDGSKKGKSFNENVLKMSQRQREIFLQEILLWDGSQGKHNIKVYSNTDRTSLLWAQTIAHLSSRQALMRLEKHNSGFSQHAKPIWRLSFNRRRFAARECLTYERKNYVGMDVYCFTVPSGYFLVRCQDTISVTGNSDYLEGLQLKSDTELRKPRLKAEIDAGARLVFPEWKFNRQTVTFTGANLARRAFGDASWESRKRALGVVSRYFDSYPGIRDLQRRITEQCERDKAVITPLGYYLLSYGPDEDRMKQAAAVWGSLPIAHLTKLALIGAKKHELYTSGRWFPILQIHDELLVEVRNDVPPEEAARALRQCMEQTLEDLDGFWNPVEVSFGPNWRDMKKITREETK
jgi:DNA polymerase I-like protein with 3'-5' exonuclease and polymerase domains